MSIRELIITHNRAQSAAYVSPSASLLRDQWTALHRTDVIAFKCMDGRLNLPVITGAPVGVIKPLRNLGGMFDLGWPHLKDTVREMVTRKVGRGRDVFLLVTYHFSAGDTHRGCRGFGYDVQNALAFTTKFLAQAERVFGTDHQVVYPIQVGVETDEDALIVHGTNGERLDMAKMTHASESDLLAELVRLFPDMKHSMVTDLLALLAGNQRHVADVRKTGRTIEEAEHGERVLAIGQGFDWLHVLNLALIVGPYSPNLDEPIATAGGILLNNVRNGRVPDNRVLLMACAPFRERGIERTLAVEKAAFMARFARETLEERVPDLVPMLETLTAVVDHNTRLLELLD